MILHLLCSAARLIVVVTTAFWALFNRPVSSCANILWYYMLVGAAISNSMHLPTFAWACLLLGSQQSLVKICHLLSFELVIGVRIEHFLEEVYLNAMGRRDEAGSRDHESIIR